MEYCIAHEIMANYLREHEWEVLKMYQYEYNVELDRKAHYQDGYEDGMKQGINVERASIVRNLYRAGATLDLIKTATGWTEEQIIAAVNAEK